MELEVIDRIYIGANTLVSVSHACKGLKNGDIIFDNNKKAYVILRITTGNNMGVTNLLLRGTVKVDRLYIES